MTRSELNEHMRDLVKLNRIRLRAGIWERFRGTWEVMAPGQVEELARMVEAEEIVVREDTGQVKIVFSADGSDLILIKVRREEPWGCWEMTRPSSGRRTASPNLSMIAEEVMNEVRRAGGRAIVEYDDLAEMQFRATGGAGV